MHAPINPEWMTASEAAARLGISRQTLYAYVSRGRLTAQAVPGQRANHYRRGEVERLATVHAAARKPRRVAEQTLDWGLPVLNSSLTLIQNGQFHYRGHDAVALAASSTLEDVAALLWGCDRTTVFDTQPPVLRASIQAGLRRAAAQLGPQRLVSAWGLLPTQDASALPRAEQAVWLLRAMAVAATQQLPPRNQAGNPLHEQMRQAWQLPAEAGNALRQALVLCADHELNASSFTARCVAATGAGLAAAITAGLAALSGPRHGGMTARVEALWPRVQSAGRSTTDLRRWIIEESQRHVRQREQQGLQRIAGDALAGFGHPLYPDGDPRARALLALLPPDRARDRFAALVHELTGQPPALDFALVALRRSLGAPEGSAFALFALARTVGWIAHAIEQQDSGALIRPRATYVGPQPTATVAASPVGRVIRKR